MNAEENADAKTENWSNVVAFEENLQTCPTLNAFATSTLLSQLRPTQLTSPNMTPFCHYTEQSLALVFTIKIFSCHGIVGSYYNMKIFYGISIVASPFLIGTGVWSGLTLSRVRFGTQVRAALVGTECQGVAV
jgi:hypothetical protein